MRMLAARTIYENINFFVGLFIYLCTSTNSCDYINIIYTKKRVIPPIDSLRVDAALPFNGG